MIRAEYDRKGLSLTVQGHGGGKYGEDIVCAAASILVYTLASDLERLGRRWVRKMEVSLREGTLSSPAGRYTVHGQCWS